MVAAMDADDYAQLSAAWLEQLQRSAALDVWAHGFSLVHLESGVAIGKCGFKGPPTSAGEVEIAYGIDPAHQGNGYATEAAAALVQFAFADARVRIVLAHTLPNPNASTRVLTKCGFRFVDAVVDPEDGLVWRWERSI